MEINEYQKLALRTVNKDLDKRDLLINAVMGLCGESGEVIDIVKKHISHNHPLDSQHIVEELGDVAWYMAELSYVLGYDLEEVFNRNIEKLKKRYPDGFDYDKSINRER